MQREIWASLVALMVKHLPAMHKTRVQSLGKIPWRREWQLTPVFLPGEFHEQRCLAGYSAWGCKELDTTKRLTHKHTHTETRVSDRSSVLMLQLLYPSPASSSIHLGGTKVTVGVQDDFFSLFCLDNCFSKVPV